MLDLLRDDAERAYAGYAELLNEDETGAPRDPSWPGLARELARMNLSLNFYTQWYWKTDLHNLLHFLSLRADPHAQYEIRAYAETMLETVQRWVPLAHAAFLEYRMNAATISATGLAVLRRMLAGETVDQPSSGLSPREWRELMAVLGRETGVMARSGGKPAAEVDFSDFEQAQAWFRRQPREVCIALAMRSALRVLPLIEAAPRRAGFCAARCPPGASRLLCCVGNRGISVAA